MTLPFCHPAGISNSLTISLSLEEFSSARQRVHVGINRVIPMKNGGPRLPLARIAYAKRGSPSRSVLCVRRAKFNATFPRARARDRCVSVAYLSRCTRTRELVIEREREIFVVFHENSGVGSLTRGREMRLDFRDSTNKRRRTRGNPWLDRSSIQLASHVYLFRHQDARVTPSRGKKMENVREGARTLAADNETAYEPDG